MPAFYQQKASSAESLGSDVNGTTIAVDGPFDKPFNMADIQDVSAITHRELIKRIVSLEEQTQGLLRLTDPLPALATPSLVDDGLDGKGSLSLSPTGQKAPGKGISTPLLVAQSRPSSKPDSNEATQPAAERFPIKTANEILSIIERYGYSHKTGPDATWAGRLKFLPIVEGNVRAGRSIRMVLPAFPFKSPNRQDKVLGSSPDLGEEIALAHLNGMCQRIGELYEPGAEVYITSDGLVYNDILGVSDEDAWTYGEGLRQLSIDKEFNHIKFVRLWDILEHTDAAGRPKEYYLIHASCLRRELLARYAVPGFNAHAYLRSDEDACLTYRGYIKFLYKDLLHTNVNRRQDDGGALSGKKYKEAVENIARVMISRGKAFAAAIKARFDDCVRLSIHSSIGQEKLSVSLIPQKGGNFGHTPWHSSVAVGIDGSFSTVHASDVRETHDLIYRDGKPYYFREKSDMYDWGTIMVEFEHLYPSGLIIRPSNSVITAPSLKDVDMTKVRRLAELQSPVVCRGFADTTVVDVFQSKAHELGIVVPWMYGIMQKVKDSGRTDNMGNNVVSNEVMPMHYDGVFKFATKTDENGNEVKVQHAPRFQLFAAIATAPRGTGYTLFASSRRFFQHLPPPYTVDRLEKVTWAIDNTGFWDAKLKDLPLVVRHPVHQTPCLRWHEPWPESKTKFSACDVIIENDAQEIAGLVDSLLYDRRVCLYFTSEKGDVLVSDNIAMLHTCTSFAGNSDRELWRIHLD